MEKGLPTSINHSRPPIPNYFSSESHDISFYQTEVDEGRLNSYIKEDAVSFFGITDQGRSVVCNVINFELYFYIIKPDQISLTGPRREEKL